MYVSSPRLFQDQELRDHLGTQKEKIEDRVQSLSPAQVRNGDMEALIDEVIEPYRYKVPALAGEEDWEIAEEGETTIEKRSQWPGEKETFAVQGYYYTFAIPYEGDIELIKYKPDQWDHNPPNAENLEIQSGEIRLRIKDQDPDAVAIESKLKDQVQKIEKYLDWSREQVEPYNNNLRGVARKWLRRRKERLEKQQDVSDEMGFSKRSEQEDGTE